MNIPCKTLRKAQWCRIISVVFWMKAVDKAKQGFMDFVRVDARVVPKSNQKLKCSEFQEKDIEVDWLS